MTFHVPGSSREPVEVDVRHSGLRMILVTRESIRLLDDSWDVLGVYFLLGPGDDPERFRAYIGQVRGSTLVRRVKDHARKKDWWSRALLIGSASREGFNSAEIGWLEGRLFQVLAEAVACEVMNTQRPGDESLRGRERDLLERFVDPISAALRASGYPPDAAGGARLDAVETSERPRKPRRPPSPLVALIREAGIAVPLEIHADYRGARAVAEILRDGRVGFDGRSFDSLSSAGSAARMKLGYRGSGHASTNGWTFWQFTRDGVTLPLATLRAPRTQS